MKRWFGTAVERLAVFGTCRRCTRLSGRAAAVVGVIALMSAASIGPSAFTASTCLAAVLCCTLWIAHRVAAGRRRSPVTGLLRAFGADRSEARAIIAAFPQTLELADLRAGRLSPGEILNVTRIPRLESSGVRISRVVVTRGGKILTEVIRTQDGRFTPVDTDDDTP